MTTRTAAPVEHFVSGGKSIDIDVFAPAGTGRHPSTVILYGAFGLLPEYGDDILSFGEALAAKGIVAFVPHYFERTGTEPGLGALAAIPQHYASWRQTCGDALLFARTHARVSAGRLGILGFSLGGHFALSQAMTSPAGVSLKCVVDFFGPVVNPPLTGNRAAMPPVLIHHGEKDDLVNISDSRQLVSELRAAGKIEGVGYTLMTYRDQGHGFAGADLVAARSKTVEFLASIL
jgi:dienelactone hydrolase